MPNIMELAIDYYASGYTEFCLKYPGVEIPANSDQRLFSPEWQAMLGSAIEQARRYNWHFDGLNIKLSQAGQPDQLFVMEKHKCLTS